MKYMYKLLTKQFMLEKYFTHGETRWTEVSTKGFSGESTKGSNRGSCYGLRGWFGFKVNINNRGRSGR